MIQKLWIDTDMGGDIDDALAISMALHTRELQIIGISTVYIGNAWRTDLVRSMMEAFGRSGIQVRLGAEKPLVGLWNNRVPEPSLPNDAVPTLIKAAKENPGLFVAAIGPLTNIALALAQAPEIAGNLRLYIMGGMVTMAYPEWNIACDPEAARIVFESGAEITLVGLDVTEKCHLSKEEALALVMGESREMRFLRGEMERFLTSFNFLPVLHDPLAVAAMIWDDLLTFESKDIAIETRGEYTRGVTVDRRFSEKRPIRAAVSVNAKEAVERMVNRIRGEM
jgi:inosine-uridine nucleoside N-ribohydrolase